MERRTAWICGFCGHRVLDRDALAQHLDETHGIQARIERDGLVVVSGVRDMMEPGECPHE